MLLIQILKCHRLKEELDGKQCFTIIHNSKYESDNVSDE